MITGTVFVTGAGGFVGRNLLRAFAEQTPEAHVVGADLNFPDEFLRIHPKVELVRMDLSDFDACRSAIARFRPSHIVHLAGSTSKVRNAETQERLFSANVLSTCHLLEALRDQREGQQATSLSHFLLASTGLIYGNSQSPFNEEMRPAPPDSYSLSKLLAEEAVAAFARMGVIEACIFRPAILYGPDQTGEMFVPSLVNALRESRHFPMTLGAQTRDFVHVRDMVEALLFAAERKLEGTYNVGSGSAVTMQRVAHTLASAAGRLDLLGLGELPYRQREVWDYSLCPTRLAEAGWRAQIELEEGLKGCLEMAK